MEENPYKAPAYGVVRPRSEWLEDLRLIVWCSWPTLVAAAALSLPYLFP